MTLADISQRLYSTSITRESHKISTPPLFTLFRSISTLFIHIRSHVTRKIAALSRPHTAATNATAVNGASRARGSFLRHRGPHEPSIGSAVRALAWWASNGDRRREGPSHDFLHFLLLDRSRLLLSLFFFGYCSRRLSYLMEWLRGFLAMHPGFPKTFDIQC